MAQRIQFRRDTAANWTATNPILAQGELGYETDTKQFKLGDGSTAWASLGYGAVDGTALKKASNLSDLASAATARSNLGIYQKQYVIGTAYTNGTPTITFTNAGSALVRGVMIPYQTDDGAWRMKLSLAWTQTASGTNPVFTISGITSKNVTNWYQAGVGNFGDTAWTDFTQTRNSFYVSPNSNTFTAVVSSATTANLTCFIDFELNGKPTWAD